MAFAFQEESNKNIFTYVTALMIGVAVIGGVYMLFFSKTPLMDMVAPPEVDSVAKLSKVSFGTGDLSSNTVFASLKPQVSEAKAGPSGRANPFSPF